MFRLFKIIKIHLVLFILVSITSCEYNETKIVKSNNFKRRIVFKVTGRYSIKPQKEKYLIDSYDENGYWVKRERYLHKRKFFLYNYNENGQLINEGWYDRKLKKSNTNKYYFYDKFNNLIHQGNSPKPPRFDADYTNFNKIKSIVFYDSTGKYLKFCSFKYDWKRHLREKIELVYNDSHSTDLVKYEYKYNISGQLQFKKKFTQRLGVKPIIKDNKLLITHSFDKNYKLKEICEYKYNNYNLLKEEIRTSHSGHFVEKLVYEYE